MLPLQHGDRLDAYTMNEGVFMSTKGKSWSWSEESKDKLRGERPSMRGNQNGKKHGLSRTLEYNSWKKMMARCYKDTDPYYHCYGGRGISVCKEWHDPINFCHDMGSRKKGFSLERVDVNGNYEPDNCIWLPMRFQAVNRTGWKHTEEGKKRIGEATRKRNLAKRTAPLGESVPLFLEKEHGNVTHKRLC